jgi:hypothetical protein
LHSTAKRWRCDICGRVAVWSADWQWYGSELSRDEYAEKGMVVTCSDKCRETSDPEQILRARGVRNLNLKGGI